MAFDVSPVAMFFFRESVVNKLHSSVDPWLGPCISEIVQKKNISKVEAGWKWSKWNWVLIKLHSSEQPLLPIQETPHQSTNSTCMWIQKGWAFLLEKSKWTNWKWTMTAYLWVKASHCIFMQRKSSVPGNKFLSLKSCDVLSWVSGLQRKCQNLHPIQKT